MRDLFSGELTRDKFQEVKNYKWEVKSSFYDIDLDGDGWAESFTYSKKDGEDWIQIYDKHKKLIFNERIPSKGAGSWVYKLSFHQLGPSYGLLMIYHNEGYTHYLNYENSSRLYFLTIDKKDLTNLKLTTGPIVWKEEERRYKEYGQREYEVGLKDLDEDGVRDVVVRHHTISRVYLYRGNGVWVHP